jgi:hypothetical protein
MNRATQISAVRLGQEMPVQYRHKEMEKLIPKSAINRPTLQLAFACPVIIITQAYRNMQ